MDLDPRAKGPALNRPAAWPKIPAHISYAAAAGRRRCSPRRRPTTAPPKLTRQRKLRHIDVGSVDVEPGDLGIDDDVSDRSSSSSPPQQRGRSSASEAIGIAVGTPISRSASSREGGAQPPRSASSPVLHPLPLPSPRLPDPLGIADGWGDRTTLAARCGVFCFQNKSPLFLLSPNLIGIQFDRMDDCMCSMARFDCL